MDGIAAIIGRRAVGRLVQGLHEHGALGAFLEERRRQSASLQYVYVNGPENFVGGRPTLSALFKVGYSYARSYRVRRKLEHNIDMSGSLLWNFHKTCVSFTWAYTMKGVSYWSHIADNLWRMSAFRNINRGVHISMDGDPAVLWERCVLRELNCGNKKKGNG